MPVYSRVTTAGIWPYKSEMWGSGNNNSGETPGGLGQNEADMLFFLK